MVKSSNEFLHFHLFVRSFLYFFFHLSVCCCWWPRPPKPTPLDSSLIVATHLALSTSCLNRHVFYLQGTAIVTHRGLADIFKKRTFLSPFSCCCCCCSVLLGRICLESNDSFLLNNEDSVDVAFSFIIIIAVLRLVDRFVRTSILVRVLTLHQSTDFVVFQQNPPKDGDDISFRFIKWEMIAVGVPFLNPMGIR